MKRVIVSLPNHDDTTRYLSEMTKILIKRLDQTGKALFTLVEGGEFVKATFESRLKATSFDFVFINAHGFFDSIIGNDGKSVVTSAENEGLFNNKIVYARSCSAAAVLGKTSVKKGCRAFIGYVGPFMFLFDPRFMSNPAKDELSRPFFESTNLIPESIVKGNSVADALEKSKNKYEKEIAYFETVNSPEAPTLVALLKYNLSVQKGIGDVEAKL